MKKFIAIFLAILFALSLVSCADDNTDTNTPGSSQTENENEKVSRGVISEDAYKNNFAGFTFNKPADWVYLTDKEIADTIDAGQAELDLNAIQETLAKKASIYDMVAKNTAGESVMVVYENTMLTALKKISADEYLDSVKTQLKAMSSIQYTFGEIEDVTIGSTQFKKMALEASSNGVDFVQAYYVRTIGYYAVGIVVTTFSDAGVSDIEAMFS